MACEVCRRDTHHETYLPIRQKNGNLQTMACLPCARASNVYCLEHDTAHIVGSFQDNTTFCVVCADRIVEQYKDLAETIAQQVLNADTEGNLEEIVATEGLPPEFLKRFSPSRTILNLVVRKALRTKKTPEEVVAQLVAENSTEYIFT
jgi:hypothetical protein